ncbi:MAG: phage holin family protein [Pirellulales bacterium]
MIGQSVFTSLGRVCADIGRLGKLQIDLYVADFERSKKKMLIAAVMAAGGAFFSIATFVLLLIGLAWTLHEHGLSLSVALFTTAGASLFVCLVLVGSAFALARAQLKRFETANTELKINLACIRDQILNSTANPNTTQSA